MASGCGRADPGGGQKPEKIDPVSKHTSQSVPLLLANTATRGRQTEIVNGWLVFFRGVYFLG